MEKQSVIFYLKDAVVNFLIGNTKTIDVGNQTLQLWTLTTEALNLAWLKGNPGEKNELDTLIEKIKKDLGNKDELKKDLDKLNNLMGSDQTNLWNSNDITELMGDIAAAGGNIDDKDKTNELTLLQQKGTGISAQMTQEGSIGDTQGKAQGNVVSGLASAIDSIKQIGDSVNGIGSKVAGELSQLA